MISDLHKKLRNVKADITFTWLKWIMNKVKAYDVLKKCLSTFSRKIVSFNDGTGVVP